MTNYKPYKYIGKTQQLLYLIWVELGKLAAKGLSAGWGLAGNTGNSGSAFLGTIDSKDLTIKTANTTALTIDTSQNVGIRTSTPSAKLDVQGTVNSDVAFADTNSVQTTNDQFANPPRSNQMVLKENLWRRRQAQAVWLHW